MQKYVFGGLCFVLAVATALAAAEPWKLVLYSYRLIEYNSGNYGPRTCGVWFRTTDGNMHDMAYSVVYLNSQGDERDLDKGGRIGRVALTAPDLTIAECASVVGIGANLIDGKPTPIE